MRILSLLIFCGFLFFSGRQPDSPHGSDFKISCITCHSSKGWQLDKEIYSFDHNTTKLPLVGQHKEINCRHCHSTLVFSEAKSTCNECHKDIHQGTTGSDCSRCHTPASWLVNNITEIHQVSRFPLIGAHRTADCIACHKSESLVRFDVPGVNCIDCHRSNFMATTNPNHPEAGFSEDCSTCHPVNAFQWAGVGFNHNFFPLIQAHASPKCADCHTTGYYKDASPVCYSCHEKDFLGAINPDHNASSFSKTCTDCHSLTSGWKPANFDHSSFALTLGHAVPKCIDCHIGGNYNSTPTDCYACHKENYNSTINPNHQAIGFSTTCSQCHTTNPGWKPATYRQHDSQFPVYSGRHQGQWSSCLECHSNTSDYSVFTCIDCHAHNQSDMDNKHIGEVSGYSYKSTECFRCHPRGQKE
jgi:hypothetical protein